MFDGWLYTTDAWGGLLRKTRFQGGVTENIDLRSLLVTQGHLPPDGPSQTLGCVSATTTGRLLLAITAGLFLFDPDSQALTFLAHPNAESCALGGRYNDGKPGPDGALYVGGMSPNPDSGGGRLFRVAPDGSVSEPLKGAPELYYPNGLHWNPSDDPNVWMLYYVDSKYPAIQVYRHFLKEVRFEREADLIAIPAEEYGFPDGMTGTDNGLLILALYHVDPAEGEERFFGPVVVDIATRQVIERIVLPVPQATSVALNGSVAYLTSGAERYQAENFKRFPLAGTLFSADLKESTVPQVAQALGLPPLKFRDVNVSLY